jgi:hypothetical protein
MMKLDQIPVKKYPVRNKQSRGGSFVISKNGDGMIDGKTVVQFDDDEEQKQ